MSGESCSLCPRVRNKQGELVDSRLFKDLHHFISDRKIEKQYYVLAKDEAFLSKVKDLENFKTDENGEITMQSLMELAKLEIQQDKIINTLNKDLGEGKYSISEAMDRISSFNEDENNLWKDKYVAFLEPVGNKKFTVHVIPKASKGNEKQRIAEADSRDKTHKLVRNHEMERRILNLLENYKVSPKFIQDIREGGVYSTEGVHPMENGLWGLIEINENEHTTDTLAEEAGHFAVGAMGEHPLVTRLQKILSDNKVLMQIASEISEDESLGANPSRELAGKLVGKALQKKLSTSNSIINNLATRIANAVKQMFYKLTGNDLKYQATKAKDLADRIAYQFTNESDNFSVENAVSVEETLHHSSLSPNQKHFKRGMDELGRMMNALRGISSNKFTTQQVQAVAAVAAAASDFNSGTTALTADTNIFADNLALHGIAQILTDIQSTLVDDIGGIIDSVDFNNPAEFYKNMASNGRHLKQARIYLDAAATILSELQQGLYQDSGEVLTTMGTTSGIIEYVDITGNPVRVDIGKIIRTCMSLVNTYSSHLTAKETNFFVRFCEDAYGHKYITTVSRVLFKNIWNSTENGAYTKEENISIDSFVRGNDSEDIDIFHRFLGTMSNNPDVIGQIVDKTMKAAAKLADDNTGVTRDELLILDKRAKMLGLKYSDLAERDDNGKLTGNIISLPVEADSENPLSEDNFIYEVLSALPEFTDWQNNHNSNPSLNYGKWENEFAEFKKQLQEAFIAKYPNHATLPNLIKGIEYQKFVDRPIKNWHKAHSINVPIKDKDGNIKYVKRVPNLTYATDRLEVLTQKYPDKNGESVRAWLKDYLKLKKELDAKLPYGATTSYRLPQFAGTYANNIDNMMKSTGKSRFKSTMKVLWRRMVLDTFLETAKDEDFGTDLTMNAMEHCLLGNPLSYEAERVNRVPVFGVNKLKNMDELATDNLIGITLAYASMANSYNILNSVVGSLEVGREVLYRRKFTSPNVFKKTFNYVGSIHRNVSGSKRSKYDGNTDYAFTRYIKYLDKQLYGISAPKVGITIGGNRLVLNKVAETLSTLAGFSFLQGNVLGGTVNTLTGHFNIMQEAASNAEFSLNDLKFAHKYYFENYGNILMEWGKQHKMNKLSLFLEEVDSQNDRRGSFRDFDINKSRLKHKLLNLGYFPYSGGDHYMQAMSYLAVAHKIQLYDTFGNKRCNLWDAFERVENTDALTGVTTGSRLQFTRLLPVNENEITVENLDTKMVFLKTIPDRLNHFEEWLEYTYPEFRDAAYKKDHEDEYNALRADFSNLTDDEKVMGYIAERYGKSKDILIKLEAYLQTADNPFAILPMLSPVEKDYIIFLQRNNNNAKIYDIASKEDVENLQAIIRKDIYSLIYSKLDEIDYINKCRELNVRMHGVYNSHDKTTLHQNWYTNAVLAMRGWVLGYLERILSNEHYSIALGTNVEGFINTALKIPLSSIIGTIKKTPNHIGALDLILMMVDPFTNKAKRKLKAAGFSDFQYANAKKMWLSVMLQALLFLIKAATAPPPKDERDYDDENRGLASFIHYFAMRTLYEQQVFVWPVETMLQSKTIMDLMPVGAAALWDWATIGYELMGATVAPKTDSTFYYQNSDKYGRNEEGDSKGVAHLSRLIPYYKNMWALSGNMDAASESYEFGRKFHTN